ncbi:hypothetical protein RclHR1_11290002 [Rhizophagus clarus]|uniref:Uncharacterized protein n=1 Tax=Rhizophagus clarus TaxID=94130 RepID=A0A2Z6QVL0_9GLOM|nr:hypothetical protein RclHR1_11290002 [Rhizophagus clarus]
MASLESSLRRSSSVSSVSTKEQKVGKSFIPRFKTFYSKQTKNGKPSLTRVDTTDYYSFKKDSARTRTSISYSQNEPLKTRNILRKPKKVESLLSNIQEKSRQKIATSLLGKSKIPVPASTKKMCVSTPSLISTKNAAPSTRVSHRNCTSCAKSKSLNTTVNTANTVKRKNSRINRIKDNQDDPIKNDNASTSSSIKKPLRKLSQTFLKKRVSPLQPSTPKREELSPTPTLITPPLSPTPTLFKRELTSSPPLIEREELSPTPSLFKRDELPPFFTSHKETNDLVCTPKKNKRTSLLIPINVEVSSTSSVSLPPTPTSLTYDELLPTSTYDELSPTTLHKETNDLVCSSTKNTHTYLQKSINKPEASISTTQIVEVSSTTSIIEKNSSVIDDENGEDVPKLLTNVYKNVVRFSRFISKIKIIV